MSALHAQDIVTDHATDMDDSPQALAMLRLAVAVVHPETRPLFIRGRPRRSAG